MFNETHIVAIAVALGVYLFPLFIAGLRRHPYERVVGVINVFLGWTFIGWVVALAIAVSPIRRDGK